MEGLVPPASDGMSRVPPYSRTPPRRALLSPTGVSPSWLARPRDPSARSTPSTTVRAASLSACGAAQPRPGIGSDPTQPARFGLRPVRSPLLRPSRLISLPQGTEMFQFPHVPPGGSLPSPPGDRPRQTAGLPHSGIHGSAWLTAPRGFSQSAHALLRPFAPRHPPCAALPSASTRLSSEARPADPPSGL